MENKPGWKTTEFYVTLVAQALAIAVLLGYLRADHAADLNNALAQSIQAVAGLVASVLTAWKYVSSRTEVKLAEPTPPNAAK